MPDPDKKIEAQAQLSDYEKFKAACAEKFAEKYLTTFVNPYEKPEERIQREGVNKFFLVRIFEKLVQKIEETFPEEMKRKGALRELVAGGMEIEIGRKKLTVTMAPIIKRFILTDPEVAQEVVKIILEAGILANYNNSSELSPNFVALAHLQKGGKLTRNESGQFELSMEIKSETESDRVKKAKEEKTEKEKQIPLARQKAAEEIEAFLAESEKEKTAAIQAHNEKREATIKVVDQYLESLRETAQGKEQEHILVRDKAAKAIHAYREAVRAELIEAEREYAAKKEKVLAFLREQNAENTKEFIDLVQKADTLTELNTALETCRKTYKGSEFREMADQLLGTFRNLEFYKTQNEKCKSMRDQLVKVALVSGKADSVMVYDENENENEVSIATESQMAELIRRITKESFKYQTAQGKQKTSKGQARETLEQALRELTTAFGERKRTAIQYQSAKKTCEKLLKIATVSGGAESIEIGGKEYPLRWANGFVQAIKEIGDGFYNTRNPIAGDKKSIEAVRSALDELINAFSKRKEITVREEEERKICETLLPLVKGEKTAHQFRNENFERQLNTSQLLGSALREIGGIFEKTIRQDEQQLPIQIARKKVAVALGKIVEAMREVENAGHGISMAINMDEKQKQMEYIRNLLKENSELGIALSFLISTKKREQMAQAKKEDVFTRNNREKQIGERTELLRWGDVAISYDDLGNFDSEGRFFIPESATGYVEGEEKMEALKREIEKFFTEREQDQDLPPIFIDDALTEIQILREAKKQLETILDETREKLGRALGTAEQLEKGKTTAVQQAGELNEQISKVARERQQLEQKKTELEEQIGKLNTRITELEGETSRADTAEAELKKERAARHGFDNKITAIYRALRGSEEATLGGKQRRKAIADLKAALIEAGIITPEEK